MRRSKSELNRIDRRGPAGAAEVVGDLEPVAVGEHEVEHDDVGIVLSDGGLDLVGRRHDADDVVAVVDEDGAHEVGEPEVVVDEEHAGRGHCPWFYRLGSSQEAAEDDAPWRSPGGPRGAAPAGWAWRRRARRRRGPRPTACGRP